MAFFAGQEVEADDLNPPAAKLYRGTDQLISNDTYTKVLLDTVEFNYRSVADTANNRLLVPSAAGGLYSLRSTVRWAASNTTGTRAIKIRVNGVDKVQESGPNVDSPSGSTSHSVSTDVVLAAGDSVELYVYQNSGASVNVTTNFGGTQLSMFRIRA